MTVYLRLLGGARVELDGTPMRGRAAHRRRLALLALLTTAPANRLARERIVDYLWPESDSESGRRLLSESLHVIRRELAADSISSYGDELALNTSVVGSDVAEFRSAMQQGELDRAVELYSGPFLDAWYVEGSSRFEEWADAERSTLASEYASALERLANRHEAAGDWPAAARRWRQLSALQPESAAHVARLARALASAGEQALGLRAILAHVTYMEGEGLPVADDVRSLEQELRAVTPRSTPPSPRPRDLVAAAESPDQARRRVASGVLHPIAAGEESAASLAPGDLIQPHDGRRRRLALGLTSAVAGLLLLVWLGAGRLPNVWHWGASAGESAAALDSHRVAVLYFDARGDGAKYLADAFTEQLVTELSRVSALEVVSLSGVKPFRESDLPDDSAAVDGGDVPRAVPLDSIARRLRSGTLIEGTVRRDGDRVRVTVRLVDANTGTTIGGTRTVEHALHEQSLFALQDEVGQEVAVALRQRLGRAISLRAPRTGTTSARAQDLLIRAEHGRKLAEALTANPAEGSRRRALATLVGADSLLAEAERLDARWLEPIVLRGWLAYDAVSADTANARHWRDVTLAHAERALGRDSVNAAALALRGTAEWLSALSGWPDAKDARQWRDSAARDLRRAISRDSTQIRALILLSQLVRATSRSRTDLLEAVDLARLAFERDSYLASATNVIGMLFRANLRLGMLDSARSWCARGRELEPDAWAFRECELTLARQDLAHADPARMWAIVDTLAAMRSRPAVGARTPEYSPYYERLIASAVSARHGDVARAATELASVRAAVAARGGELPVDVKHDEVLLWLALGQRDSAMKSLQEYLAALPAFTGYVLSDPAFRQFRLDSASLAARLVASARP